MSHLFNINHLVTALLNEDGIVHMLKVKHLIKCFVTALCTVPCSTSKRHFSRFRKLWREPSAAVWLSFYTEQNFVNLTHCNWKQYQTSMWNTVKKAALNHHHHHHHHHQFILWIIEAGHKAVLAPKWFMSIASNFSFCYITAALPAAPMR